MSIQGNGDLGNLQGLGRADKPGDKSSSPLALDIFGKHGLK